MKEVFEKGKNLLKNIGGKFVGLMKSMSMTQKVVVLVTAASLAVGGTATGIWYANNKAIESEPVIAKEEKKEEKVPVAADPVIIEENAIPVTMTGESVEKDLKVKFSDESGKAITGTTFQVVLVQANKDKIKDSWAKQLSDLQKQYDISEDVSKSESKNEQESANENENQQKYETAVATAYQKLLASVDGKTYQDDDKNGYIYVDKLESTDYNVWYVPVEGYDAQQKGVTVSVKDKIEYKAIDVDDQKAAYSAAQDVKGHNTATESVQKDTVAYVDSTATQTQGEVVYEPGKPVVTSVGEKISKTENGATLSTNGSAKVYNVSGVNTVNLGFELSGQQMTAAAIESKDTDVATASVNNGNIAVVAGNKPGSTVMTLQCSYDVPPTEEGAEASAQSISLDINVTNGNPSDPLTNGKGEQLYDSNGNAMQVKDYNPSATYTEKKADTTVTVYTGWQTIDGNVYYFDGNGNKVTGDQVIAGTSYHFDSDGVLVQGTGKTGIDVSKWQGNIDWKAVKNAGIDYAIIRCGGRYSKSRGLYTDPNFAKNVSGANAAGIRVGIYFYSTALNEVDAVGEASYVLGLIRGKKISYPVFIDYEDSCQSGLSKAQGTAICKAFCETIKNGGYTPGVYANYSWMTKKLDASQLGSYCIWIARYNKTLGYSGKCDIWQHTDSGRVPGISGNVDMNISYMSY